MKETGHILSFGHNWNNKLDCNCFSTIRLHNPKKYWAGSRAIVELKGKPKPHPAEVCYVKTFYLKDMTEAMALLDTGYSKEEATKMIMTMYKNIVRDIHQARFDFVVLRYINTEPTETTGNIFQ